MFLNKADNYIQPTSADLRRDNIVLLRNKKPYQVTGVYEKHIELLPLPSPTILIEKHSYTDIWGVNLKEYWFDLIEREYQTKHLIDALLLGNGYLKTRPEYKGLPASFELYFTKGDISLYLLGDQWYLGDKRFSYLHELQNELEDMGGNLEVEKVL